MRITLFILNRRYVLIQFHHLSIVVVLVLVGQWIIVTFGGEMFRTTPLSLHEWLLIVGSTSVVLWVGELWRAFKRMIAKRR